MSSPSPGLLAGTVRWAVVPYTPRPPFRLYAGEGHAPMTVPDASALIATAQQGGDAEFTYLVSGKARPVLVLNDPPAEHHREITALRLLRLSRIRDTTMRERIRRQDEPLLFHLDPARFDLPEENAAMISAIVRVHVDAVDSTGSPGGLTTDEMRIIGERVISFYGFDTGLLLERKIRELAERRRARDQG